MIFHCHVNLHFINDQLMMLGVFLIVCLYPTYLLWVNLGYTFWLLKSCSCWVEIFFMYSSNDSNDLQICSKSVDCLFSLNTSFESEFWIWWGPPKQFITLEIPLSEQCLSQHCLSQSRFLLCLFYFSCLFLVPEVEVAELFIQGEMCAFCLQ